MGQTQSEPRTYAKFVGEAKPGETKVLQHVMTILKPDDPGTLLEEFQYSYTHP